jgi:hypothetical protein
VSLQPHSKEQALVKLFGCDFSFHKAWCDFSLRCEKILFEIHTFEKMEAFFIFLNNQIIVEIQLGGT